MSQKASSTKRGYGYAHQRRRKALLAQHIDGSPCPECGKPRYRDASKNFDGHALEADHPPGQAQKYAKNKQSNLARRLLHKTCNARGGAWDKPIAKPTPATSGKFVWG